MGKKKKTARPENSDQAKFNHGKFFPVDLTVPPPRFSNPSGAAPSPRAGLEQSAVKPKADYTFRKMMSIRENLIFEGIFPEIAFRQWSKGCVGLPLAPRRKERVNTRGKRAVNIRRSAFHDGEQ
ncbi:hypothetical protein M3027_07600 [Geoalkalibacter halelectricus]|nr:hypothetical protein [Geoalkalibacter halelectricus]